MATFLHALGTNELSRRPVSRGDVLLAWDAADQLLLEQIVDIGRTESLAALVVNDTFGALAVALQPAAVTSWSDSFSAHEATQANLAANGSGEGVVTMLPSTVAPTSGYDVVLWRLPRSLDLLRIQAAALHKALAPGTRVWAAGMDKHLPERSADVLRQMGTVQTLPGKKKAHAFALVTAAGAGPIVPPASGFHSPEFNLSFAASPTVFGGGKIDVGTRLLAERLAKLPNADRIADLGCGTGILGLVAQRLQPQADLAFFDESYLAIEATEANYRANIGDPADTEATFTVADRMPVVPDHLYDVVVCNPPFHQGAVIGDGVAWQMFANARECLRMGGELWMVGNRHMEYHNKLARLFSQVKNVADNPNFVVLVATRGAMPFVKPVKRKKTMSTQPHLLQN
jgi:23S rRNA (guanine1835-N2)-methyltransferase